MKDSRFSKSGIKTLSPDELRDFCVSVRLNKDELSTLNKVRGSHRKGEALRVLAFGHLPAPIPEINAELRADLGRALGNLSTASTAMRDGEYVEIKELVHQLRSKLGGAL